MTLVDPLPPAPSAPRGPTPSRSAAGATATAIDPIAYHVVLQPDPASGGVRWSFALDPGVAPPIGVYAAVLETGSDRRLSVVRLVAPSGPLDEGVVRGAIELVGRGAELPAPATITLFGWIRPAPGHRLDLADPASDARWARVLRAELAGG